MESDKINFKVDLQRAKVYWSFYSMLFIVSCLSMLSAVIAVSILHMAGSVSFTVALIVLLILYICILASFILMAFVVWRHENRHLDELMELD